MWKVIPFLCRARCLRILMAVVLVACAFPCQLAAQELRSVTFKKRIKNLVVTEDSRYLVVVFDGGGAAVLDAVSLEKVADLDGQKAGPVLSRGGEIFYSDKSSGLVKVFAEENWELVNEIDTGVQDLVTLSAPAWEAFKGQLLASSNSKVNLVSVADDRFRTIRKKDCSGAQFTKNGDYVVENGDNKWRSFRTEDYLRGEETPFATSDENGARGFKPLFGQFWIGRQTIYAGIPPQNFMGGLGSAVIPENDPDSRIVYVADGARMQSIEIRLMDDSFSLLETVRLPEPGRRGRFEFGLSPAAVRDGDGKVTIFGADAFARELVAISFKFTPPIYADSIGTLGIPLPLADESTLVNGPEGAVIADGKLTWSPTKSPGAGEFSFKVKQVKDGKASFFRKRISVLPPKSGTAPTGLVRLKVQDKQVPLAADSAADRVAILDGDRLVVLGADGRFGKSLPLAKSYRDVACLPDGYALVGKHAVEIVSADGKTVRHTIDLNGVELLKGALGARGKYLYVTSKDPTEKELAKGFPVYRIDLSTREAVKLPRVSGMDLVLNRAGDQMVTYFSHTDIHYVGILDYVEEQIDALISYQLEGDSVRLHRAYTESMERISFLRYSADDSALAVGAAKVLSGGRMVHGSTPIFAPGSLDKPQRLIQPESGWVKDVQFHPMLDLTFLLSTNRESSSKQTAALIALDGKGVERKSIFPADFEAPNHADKLLLTPDGSAALIRGRDIYGRRILQRVEFVFSSQEQADVKRGAPTPVLAYSAGGRGKKASVAGAPGASDGGEMARGLSPKQMERLLGGDAGEKIDARRLSVLWMPSVVVVNGGSNGIGAGFFVSGDGHILTAAHCIPDLGGPEVYFYGEFPFGRTEFSSRAVVLDVDIERDLALLKVDAEVATPGVMVSSQKSAPGQEVYAIGHPGVEDLSLEYTLTAGLVSSAAREIDGQTFFQISAAVNPGNSGGPVFDDRGRVIGMVSQKAKLEGASFAVPGAEIADFLKRSKIDEEPVRPDGEKVAAAIKSKGWHGIEEIVFRGDEQRAFFRDTEKPFTGTLAIVGNPENFIFATAQYRDGRAHGHLQEYDRSSRRKRAVQFVEGKREGEIVTWYPSGNPKTEMSTSDGKPTGFLREYSDKKHAVTAAACFAKGVRHGPSYTMDAFGRVTEVAFFVEGEQVRWRRFSFYKNEEGVPIIEFVKAGDVKMVERAIEAGAKLNEPVGKTTPLQLAVESGVYYVVEALLDLGAEIDLENADGETALMVEMADSKPAVEIAQLLVRRGASKEGIPEEKLELLKEKKE